MGCLKRYDSVQDILREFFELRLHYYKLRKDWLIGSLGAEAAKLSNQARFVLEKIEGKMPIGKRLENGQLFHLIYVVPILCLDREQIQARAHPHAGPERLRVGSCRCLEQGSRKGTAGRGLPSDIHVTAVN